MRHRPKRHRLKYRLFYLLLDLDDLAQLDARLTLFGYNRAALFSFHDGDHGARDGTPLRAWVSAQLAEAGAKRLSIGGALARAALAPVLRAGKEMMEEGTFSWTQDLAANSEIHALLG